MLHTKMQMLKNICTDILRAMLFYFISSTWNEKETTCNAVHRNLQISSVVKPYTPSFVCMIKIYRECMIILQQNYTIPVFLANIMRCHFLKTLEPYKQNHSCLSFAYQVNYNLLNEISYITAFSCLSNIRGMFWENFLPVCEKSGIT